MHITGDAHRCICMHIDVDACTHTHVTAYAENLRRNEFRAARHECGCACQMGKEVHGRIQQTKPLR